MRGKSFRQTKHTHKYTIFRYMYIIYFTYINMHIFIRLGSVLVFKGIGIYWNLHLGVSCFTTHKLIVCVVEEKPSFTSKVLIYHSSVLQICRPRLVMKISGISKRQHFFRLSLGNLHVYPNQNPPTKIYARIMVADVRDKGYLRARRSEIGDVELVKRGHLVELDMVCTVSMHMRVYIKYMYR